MVAWSYAPRFYEVNRCYLINSDDLAGAPVDQPIAWDIAATFVKVPCDQSSMGDYPLKEDIPVDSRYASYSSALASADAPGWGIPESARSSFPFYGSYDSVWGRRLRLENASEVYATFLEEEEDREAKANEEEVAALANASAALALRHASAGHSGNYYQHRPKVTIGVEDDVGIELSQDSYWY